MADHIILLLALHKTTNIPRPPMTRLIVLPQEKLSVMVNCLSFVEKKYTQLAVYVSND